MELVCANPTCRARGGLPRHPTEPQRVLITKVTGWTFNREGDLRWLCPRCSRDL